MVVGVPLNVKMMNTGKTNVSLEVTNPLPKENLEQGLEQILDAINGFIKWKWPIFTGPRLQIFSIPLHTPTKFTTCSTTDNCFAASGRKVHGLDLIKL